MRPSVAFHLRASVFAGTHFVFCGLLGAALLAMTVADVLTTASEAAPPGWLGVLYWLLSILNAPMAGFFGLWQDTHPGHLPLLLLAAAWSLTLGYLISLAWLAVARQSLRGMKTQQQRSNPAHPLERRDEHQFTYRMPVARRE